ncbi:MAG: beta-lactamase family protein, partial [Flavobacteriales bacterium]|nr:beta-lactamase family protein [Flavobacteriales bacterium]
GPTCEAASELSFGHTGFTGTMAWADPKEGLVYVFLSNRVYPNAENRKLLNMNIRTDIQEVIYEAIRKAKVRKNEQNLFPDWKAEG